MFTRNSVKLPGPLLERAGVAAQEAGYSSVEEFVTHAVEKELARLEEAEAKEAVVKQLKGLGYLE
jgi:metal-responsive CopG/Arc/MetJ family transcriptional regulator